MEWRWLEKQSSQFWPKEVHLSGRGMDWGFTFLKAAFYLEWESAGRSSEQVFLGSFSFLRTQPSSALSSGSQCPASLRSQSYWKSNIVHSEKTRQYCQISALSLPNALRETFPTSSDRWLEECSLHTALMVASSWATSLGMLWLGQRELRGPTVHICTTLWNRCMIGDFTLLSHKTLKHKFQWVYTGYQITSRF